MKGFKKLAAIKVLIFLKCPCGMNDGPDQGAHLITSDGDELGPGADRGSSGGRDDLGLAGGHTATQWTTQHLDLWRNWGRSRQRTGLWWGRLWTGRHGDLRVRQNSSSRTLIPDSFWAGRFGVRTSGLLWAGPDGILTFDSAWARWPPWTRGGHPGTESSCQIHYQLHPTLGLVLQLFRLATCSLCMAANSPTIRASASTTGPVVVPPCHLLGFGTTVAWMTDPTT